MAEKHYNESPYSFCGGNPVNRIDPDGNDYLINIQRDKEGKIIGITFTATVYIQGDGASKDKAAELTQLASKTFKTKEVDGVQIGFDVTYQYDPDVKNKYDTKINKGENFLDFTDQKPNRAKGEDSQTTSAGPTLAGYAGEIYDSRDKSSNHDVMHETFHMLGFSDRYDKAGNALSGYKKDLMGTRGAMNVSYNYYKIIKSYVDRNTKSPYRVYHSNVVIDKYFPNNNSEGILKY
jgi:hypothetical protein